MKEYSDFQQEIKNLKDENVIANLSDDEFSSWSKANDIQRDDLGKVVKDEDIELAAKRIRILNTRGDSKKADDELKKLKESKKKDNWTVESWNERFDEDIEQTEIDDINKSNKAFNQSLDKAVEDLLTPKPTQDAIQEQTAGQVPVQPKAPVSKEVEQGKPEAKPKVVTEEGVKAEEVAPAQQVGGEKTKVYHGADIDFTIEGKRNRIMFTSKNKNYAKYYAKQRGGKLFEFDVEKSKIANEEYVKNKIKSLGLKTEEGDLVEIDDNLHRLIDPRFDDTAISKEGLDELFTELEKEGYYGVDFMDENQELGGMNEIESTAIFNPKELLKPKKKPAKEQTPAQQVEQLRADEQAELKAAIPNAEQYLTDGKVDRDKIEDAKDLEKFDEIYDKYDKLITPLLPEKAAPAPKAAPAKAKALPKPKVATRLAFKKAVDLFYDISGTEGSAKKRTLAAKRKVFLEQNPSIKYIDDNWKAISDQLEEKGLITKKGNCP